MELTHMSEDPVPEEPKTRTQVPLPPPPPQAPLRSIAIVASIAAGVQFGWALQLSLLTPYVQLLGIPHRWASYIWLCGPISGLLVQPIVGHYSDHCGSRWGRRRPFIACGVGLVALAVILIGFAADIGRVVGDPLGPGRIKKRAIAIFVVGFWILDVANNMLQGPCRAFLADLAGKNQKKTRTANALFSFFMAVGNILGYAAGSFTRLHKLLPFSTTSACDLYCANLKTCFLISILLLLILASIALISIHDKPLDKSYVVISSEIAKENGTHEITEEIDDKPHREAFILDIFKAMRNLSRPMWILLLVTFLNWLAWFPFLLFDTDWMGKEVYGGVVNQGRLYGKGVEAGALGLMFNSIVLGCTSLMIEFLSGKVGVQRLWGGVNFILALCLGMTLLISKLAHSPSRAEAGILPPIVIRVSAMLLFALMGIPLAVTYSIPFAQAAIFSNSSGSGQGLSMGVLNLAIVIPQIVVSVGSGPWDSLFGGGNLPAFVVGAVAAVASGVVALTMLPSPAPESPIR
ncbi:hypothetical protein AAC387_Pa02g0590 [Persea americana]